MKRLTGLHVIVGGTSEARALDLATIAQEEDVSVVQFRDKSSSEANILRIAEKIRAILTDTTFIINDRPNIALVVGADGVHLGQNDMGIQEARNLLGPSTIIGVSTSTIREALAADRAGANYIGFGHMFPTRSKEKTSQPKTKEDLRVVVAAVSIPVIAIGGITEGNIENISVGGLGGIAVISAISESPNPRVAIRNLVRTLEAHHAIYA